jgi:hypothetical protein
MLFLRFFWFQDGTVGMHAGRYFICAQIWLMDLSVVSD